MDGEGSVVETVAPSAGSRRGRRMSTYAAEHARREFDDLPLGPVPSVTGPVRRGEEPAVPAVLRHDEGDVRIAGDRRVPERLVRDERIVLRGDDQGRHLDPVDHAQGRGAVIVVLGAGEAEVRR